MSVYSMTNEEREKYLKAYYDNEADANRQMGFANAFAALMMLVIWIFYLTGFFQVRATILPIINIIFPVSIAVLLSPLIYTFFKKEFLKRPKYKYFVVISFILVIATINVIIPKHTLLAWALCIIMTTHFYNTKICKFTFIVVLVSMLLCMYASMFVGEYDPNLIGNGLIIDGEIVYIDGAKERYEMLHQMLLEGENRYLKVFVYYYIPRCGILALIFLVCNTLNARTYKLLVSEIQVNSEQEKTRTELEVAKDIQLATLPSELITSKDLEIVAELKAAKEVGGDFYDYFKIDDDHVAIVIGDVSGKGIPAAMFMMKTITCFKNFIRANKSPAEILKEVNASIYEGNNSQMFVTCFLAILNKKTGKLVFANAGHNRPLIGSNRKYRYLSCNPGFILGGFEQAFVKDEEITLEHGESITLYTDGITEARNTKGEFFGEERLMKVFNKKDYTCLVELHHTIKDEISAFVGEADQSDDITFITLKYHGDKYSYSEQIFDGTLDQISAMLDFVKGFCEEHKFLEDFKSNLLVVSDELFSNVVKYGYENKGGEVFVRLLYNIDQKEFVLTLIDKAPEFNQLEVNNSMISSDVENQKEGGLGILIVKKIMSEFVYDYINGKNILVLRKKF